MELNVWSKAGADSIGLKKYYDANKQLYKWAASADVLVFNCINEKAAASALAEIKAGGNWAAVSEKSNNQVQADSGRYELLQLPGYVSTNVISVGSFSTITKNTDGTAAFVKYLKLYDGNTQRNFAEARGLVINDYQNILEQQWVADLKKKFPVKVNEVVLKEMLK
jgi:peptidyl-prolyl cis-trans isomerase SurA